jgi:hypothetical protein
LLVFGVVIYWYCFDGRANHNSLAVVSPTDI